MNNYDRVMEEYSKGNICCWNKENGIMVEDAEYFVAESSEYILDNLNRNESKLMEVGKTSKKNKWINDLSCAKVIRILKYKIYELSKTLLEEQELNDKLKESLEASINELKSTKDYINELEKNIDVLSEDNN